MKKEKLNHGDIFYLEMPGNIFVTGRVLFDVDKQYHKLVDYKALPNSQQNYFDWFESCQLLEMYKGIYKSVSQINISQREVILSGVLISGIDTHYGVETPYGKLGNIPVDYTQLEFPEYLNSSGASVFLSRGEIRLLTRISRQENDQIKLSSSLEHPTLLGKASLFLQGRPDLIKSHVYDSYFTDSLRYHPELRKRVYEEMGEDPTLSYYEFSKKRGFDLARFYEKR
jgi:hypothetical protein